MKTQLKPYIVAILCLGCFSAPIYARSDNNNAAGNKSLESQIRVLKKEMQSLKNQISLNDKKNVKHIYIHNMQPDNKVQNEKKHAAGIPLATTPTSQENHLSQKELFGLLAEHKTYLPFDLDVPGQSFVSTGPYLGVPIQFSGSNLLVNSPSVNTDLQLLAIRKTIHKQLLAMGGLLTDEPLHSHLLLSGIVESQAIYNNTGGKPSKTDIDVTNVSLDLFFMGPSDWLLGYAEFTYNNAPPNNEVFKSSDNYRVNNSRLYVSKAFATIGDLDITRLYSTFGQFYVPFGTYSTVMVSDPLPKLIGRTKARSILVGIAPEDKNSFFASAYIFRGDTHANSVAKVNNGGLNLGYLFDVPNFSGRVGAGVIASIADSGGMQEGNMFSNYEQVVHRVPAYNVRGVVEIGQHLDLIAEYVGATTRFNQNDMSYNNHGAKPSAFDLEASFSFTILCDKPSNVGIGYAKTNQALSLGIPLTRTSAVFNTSIWRNTLQSLEFRHDRNYAASDVANGPLNSPVVTSTDAQGVNCYGSACSASGKSDNIITAQFDYYF